MPLNPRVARVSQDNWACAAVCNVFEPRFYRRIVQGLDELQWSEAVQHFYRQREVNLAGNAYYEELFNEDVRREIAQAVGSFFGVQVGANFDVSAHKMITGDCIGVHTDANSLGETHRMTITLNDHWSIADGGVLLALNRGDLTCVRDAWLPTANNGFIFEISETSYHAVTPIVGNRTRYSLILTFKCLARGELKAQSWIPFVLQSDVECAMSTANHMGIPAPTFEAPYRYIEFDNIGGLKEFIGDRLENSPLRWSYRQGSSINVDQHGRQPKGSDNGRVEVVRRLRRIPPILIVRRKSGRFCLVDGSHRLGNASDTCTSIGVAVFEES